MTTNTHKGIPPELPDTSCTCGGVHHETAFQCIDDGLNWLDQIAATVQNAASELQRMGIGSEDLMIAGVSCHLIAWDLRCRGVGR